MARAGDTVERIWPPKGVPLDYRPKLVITCFHGLQIMNGGNAWKHTWSQRQNGKPWEKTFTYQYLFGQSSRTCWLEWLPLDLGERDVVIYSLSYDADMIKRNGRGQHGDVQEIAKDLIEKFVAMDEWDCPVALVGHSFGGLLIKSLIVEVDRRARRSGGEIMDRNIRDTDRRCDAFLKNVKLTVFYSTPHTGSGAVKYAANFQKVFKRLRLVRLSGILKNVQHNEISMAQLCIDFNNISSSLGFVKYNICEGQPVILLQGLKEVMVVPYASAMAGCGDNHLRVEDANHFEVCKPPNRNHISYTKLVSLCARAMAESKHPEDLIVPVGVSLMRLQMNFCT